MTRRRPRVCAALGRLGIWGRFVASEPHWRSVALDLWHGNDSFLGGTIDPRKLDQASISQLTSHPVAIRIPDAAFERYGLCSSFDPSPQNSAKEKAA